MKMTKTIKASVAFLQVMVIVLAISQTIEAQASYEKYDLFSSFTGNGEGGLSIGSTRNGLQWQVLSDNKSNLKPRLEKDSLVHSTLDDWHQAAADADFEQYFGHFSSDTAIFMGTDATERWTVAEFKPWAKPYFDQGKAWSFTPKERHVYFSADEKTAWFDESLTTPNLGPARGTGVLVQEEEAWKIVHYNLSIPIPNAIADTVVKQVEAALADTSGSQL